MQSKLTDVPMLWVPFEHRQPVVDPVHIAMRQSAAASLEMAKELGARIVTSSEHRAPLPPGGLVLFARPDPDNKWHQEAERACAAKFPDLFVTVEPLTDSSGQMLSRDMPFVLVNWTMDRGHCKYLIERSEQLEKVEAFVRANPELAHDLQVSEYIDTGKCASSYRVIVNSWGAALMLGITGTYRDPTQRVVNDRFHEVVDNPRALAIKFAFESPESRYFLNSADIRSSAFRNAHRMVALQGGLMPIRLDDGKEQFLADNGIHSLRESFFDPIFDAGCQAGAEIGPNLDLVLAIDLLRHHQTGKARICEVNYTPLVGSAFSPHGHASQGALTALRLAALEAMAYDRQFIKGVHGLSQSVRQAATFNFLPQ